MLKDKIIVLRNQLNTLIGNNASYDDVYAISMELDKLIVEYYRESSVIQ